MKHHEFPGGTLLKLHGSLLSTSSRVNKQLPDDFLHKGTTGIIISPPNGTWIKWMVNGKVGWGNWNMLEVLQ